MRKAPADARHGRAARAARAAEQTALERRNHPPADRTGPARRPREVQGDDGVHFEATVVAEAFRGKLPLARHRMVYATLGERMGGEIHALALRTLTPEEAGADRSGAISAADAPNLPSRPRFTNLAKSDRPEHPCRRSLSRRRTAERRSPDLRRQERRAADPVRDAAGRRAGRDRQRAAPARRGDHGQAARRAGRAASRIDEGTLGKGRASPSIRRTVNSHVAPYELVKTMRASILVLGPLLARYGQAEVSLPGGCAIGSRPVDQHIKGLQALGAEITRRERLHQGAAQRPPEGRALRVRHGHRHRHRERADGGGARRRHHACWRTRAMEPEVVDLADCLIAMGAKIEGAGSARIVVHGVERLHGGRYDVLPDRIETGTFLVAAAMTGGRVTARRSRADTLDAVLDKLERGRRAHQHRRRPHHARHARHAARARST